MADGHPTEIKTAGGELFLSRPFADDVRLIAIEPDVLVRSDAGIRFTFRADDAIEVTPPDDPLAPALKAIRLGSAQKLPLFELAEGRFDSAVAVWKEMLKQDPQSPGASENLHHQYAQGLPVTGRRPGPPTRRRWQGSTPIPARGRSTRHHRRGPPRERVLLLQARLQPQECRRQHRSDDRRLRGGHHDHQPHALGMPGRVR